MTGIYPETNAWPAEPPRDIATGTWWVRQSKVLHDVGGPFPTEIAAHEWASLNWRERWGRYVVEVQWEPVR